MKPFNLEEALAGKPVVTRSGHRVTNLKQFPGDMDYPLVGVVENEDELQTYTLEGKFLTGNDTQSLDLFMGTTKKTGYINIYPDDKIGTLLTKGLGLAAGTGIFSTKAEADSVGNPDRAALATFEYEE